MAHSTKLTYILWCQQVLVLVIITSNYGCKCDTLRDNSSSFPWDQFRLPDTLTPTRYHVLIKPIWFNTTLDGRVPSFIGKIQIYVDVLKATDSIILNSKYLDIQRCTLHVLSHDGAIGSGTTIDEIKYDRERLEMVHLALGRGKALVRGQKVVLNITYTGIIRTSLDGLYDSSYTDSRGVEHHLISTHFEPNYARQVFPCFDEPSYKATFQINLIRPESLKALSNMPLVVSKPYPINYYNVNLYQDQFESSVIMSTYLVAFAICDFTHISFKAHSNTLVSLYAPLEQIDQGEFALKVAVASLNFFEEFFDIKFPLPKIDLIAIPDFSAGAMENWGLITFRMNELLYKPNITSNSIKQRVAKVVAHEMAHQWFGNLVTMEWWNDLWLNEGFATYMEYLCTDYLFPEWHMIDIFIYDTARTTFLLDALEGSHPVSNEIKDPNDIQTMFDIISYDKGALLIRMLDGPVMPRTSFKKGLHKYLAKYAFQNARSQDLWHSLQEAWDEDRINASSSTLNVNLESFMSSWINQKGFPLVTVSDATGPNHTIELLQSKFGYKLKAKTVEKLQKNVGDHIPTWQIPFTMKFGTSDGTQPIKTETAWLINESSTFDIGPIKSQTLWVKGNVDHACYYKVNYGPIGWANLNQHLRESSDSFTSLDKIQLIYDVLHLTWFGHTPAVDALNFYTYVNPLAIEATHQELQEKDPLTLAVLISSLTFMFHKFRSDIYALSKLWPTFFEKLIFNNLLEIYNWRRKLPSLESILQTKVIRMAIEIGNKRTANKARFYFKEIIYNYDNNVNTTLYPDLTLGILEAGIMYGTTKDWEAAWEIYRTSNIPSEKDYILQALGATRDQNLLARFLNYSLDPSQIKSQDMITAFDSVATNNLIGSQLAWSFLRSHWHIIEERFGENLVMLQYFLEAICETFDKPEQLEEFEDFVIQHPKLPSLAVKQVRENIRLNIAWLSANSDSVKEWLKAYQ